MCSYANAGLRECTTTAEKNLVLPGGTWSNVTWSHACWDAAELLPTTCVGVDSRLIALQDTSGLARADDAPLAVTKMAAVAVAPPLLLLPAPRRRLSAARAHNTQHTTQHQQFETKLPRDYQLRRFPISAESRCPRPRVLNTV